MEWTRKLRSDMIIPKREGAHLKDVVDWSSKRCRHYSLGLLDCCLVKSLANSFQVGLAINGYELAMRPAHHELATSHCRNFVFCLRCQWLVKCSCCSLDMVFGWLPSFWRRKYIESVYLLVVVAESQVEPQGQTETNTQTELSEVPIDRSTVQ